MKYADLIRAVLDGKTIQYKYLRGDKGWIDLLNFKESIQVLVYENKNYDYRIKPEPKPDKVHYLGIGQCDTEYGHLHTTGCYDGNYIPDTFIGMSSRLTYATIAKIKFTINGETGEQTVEIVK